MSGLTAKGAATRQRIVEAAADQVLARGVGGTSLDDVRSATSTSKSQLFHYFPGGKHELVRAIVDCQGGRVLEAQRPWIDELDTWDAWAGWRDALIAHYARVDGTQGCPVGSLAAEVANVDPELRGDISAYMSEWAELLAAGVARMQRTGAVAASIDAEAAGLSLLASIQGGLLLSQTHGSLRALEVALDEALARLRLSA